MRASFFGHNSTYSIMIICHIEKTVQGNINIMSTGLVSNVELIYVTTSDVNRLRYQLPETTVEKFLYPWMFFLFKAEIHTPTYHCCPMGVAIVEDCINIHLTTITTVYANYFKFVREYNRSLNC